MGCHTWCFVALPQKQKDWRKELVRVAVSTKKYLENSLNDDTNLKRASEIYQRHYKHNIEYCKDLIQKETDINKMAEYNAELQYYETEYNRWSLENLLKGDQEKLDKVTKFLSLYKDSYLSNPKQFFLWWANVPVEVIENVSEGGLYIVRDDKIYKEDDFGIKLKDYPLGDGDFRIHDYEAADCFTAQDCFDRCAEYKVELSEEKQQRIINWFNEYPDTIINFG